MDIGIGVFYKESDTIHETVEKDEMVAVLPEGHPLCAMERVPIKALSGEPFLMLEKNGVKVTDGIVRYAEGDLDIKVSTSDDSAIVSMVEAGMGVSIMPRMNLRRNSRNVVLKPLDPPSHRRIGILTRKIGNTSITAIRFLDYMEFRNDDEPSSEKE